MADAWQCVSARRVMEGRANLQIEASRAHIRCTFDTGLQRALWGLQCAVSTVLYTIGAMQRGTGSRLTNNQD